MYTLKEACELSGFKHNVLVDQINLTTIDCMGKPLKVSNFCRDHLKFKNFARGLVMEDGRVFCESAESVKVTIQCDREHGEFCKNEKKGCLKVQKIFAHDLKLFHQSIIEHVPMELSCTFSSVVEDADELKIEPMLILPSEKSTTKNL